MNNKNENKKITQKHASKEIQLINTYFIPSHTGGVHAVCCFTVKEIQSTAAIYWPRLTTEHRSDGRASLLERHTDTQLQVYEIHVQVCTKSKHLDMTFLRRFNTSGDCFTT